MMQAIRQLMKVQTDTLLIVQEQKNSLNSIHNLLNTKKTSSPRDLQIRPAPAKTVDQLERLHGRAPRYSKVTYTEYLVKLLQ